MTENWSWSRPAGGGGQPVGRQFSTEAVMNEAALNQDYLIELGRSVQDLIEWKRGEKGRRYEIHNDDEDEDHVEVHLMDYHLHKITDDGEEDQKGFGKVVALALRKWNRRANGVA
jgi:hypothetical protein